MPFVPKLSLAAIAVISVFGLAQSALADAGAKAPQSLSRAQMIQAKPDSSPSSPLLSDALKRTLRNQQLADFRKAGSCAASKAAANDADFQGFGNAEACSNTRRGRLGRG